MKKLFHRFNFLLIFVLCVAFTSCRTTNVAVPAERSLSARLEVKHDSAASVPIKGIPILAWYGVKEHTIERYRELKEAGIDHNLTFCRNADELASALDAAKAAGVKIFASCPELSWGEIGAAENIVNRFKHHPALAGYHIIDEPSRDQFLHWGELVRRIQTVDDKHFCYVNLIPSIHPDPDQSIYGTATYREYVQSFINEVPVPFLSFDVYPIRFNGVERILLDGFYENLEIISDEARNVGKPFWAFALTTPHAHFPIPTIADLRLQVFSSLAYGTQGIQYFTYWTGPPNGGLIFHDGPIDITGQKTPTWYTVQQMSREIKALSSVFLGAKVIKVEHITVNAEGENGSVPIGTTRFDFANRPAEAQIITKFTPANGTNAMVSFLKNGNRCYMVVINRNLEGGDNMSVIIEGGTGLQLIKKDGKAVPASSESSNQTVTPGDVLIYGWDIKKK
jgi:Beta-galactosidase